jgi:cyclohexyl-isocyanide hydratase
MNRREILSIAAVSAASAMTTARTLATEARSERNATPNRSGGTRLQMLVYPGMTLLDLVGPLQVLAGLPDCEVQFAWKSAGPVLTDSGMAVNATTTFEDAWLQPDILFVPGGFAPTFELLDDLAVIEFLRRQGAGAKWVTSVCSGAILLGAAGLLQGYRASTHWAVHDSLALFGATPIKERWVIDRNRATGGGVTAGIDFGLALMAEIAGPDRARAQQLWLEYSPQPPFRSGTPAEASPETLAAVRASFGGEAGQRIQQKLISASRRLRG